MQNWRPYQSEPNTVTGDLRVLDDLFSPQLNNTRPVYVWLPPAYTTGDARYPVIYMHDGQNLFDAHISYSGEWQVDETLTTLSAEGLNAIVVGLPNMDERRIIEYCPYPFRAPDGSQQVGEGDAYIRFIIETVKPLIDATFRTHPEAATTAIAGSSMGGLISLYGFLHYPEHFGLCGAFSTAYWFGDDALLQSIDQKATAHGRIYLDVGTKEGETLYRWFTETGEAADRMYYQGVRDLRDALLTKGYMQDQTLMYVETEGAEHREYAWAARLPDALRFLLKGL